MNDCLAQALELGETTLLEQGGVDREGRPYGIGRVGHSAKPGAVRRTTPPL